MTRINLKKPGMRYMQLIRQFPLRPLRTKSDMESATGILDQLFGRENVDPGDADYVRVLAGLVEAYENEHDPIEAHAIGIEVLAHLLLEHSMTQRELARTLGIGASTVSIILSGNRPITSDHARRLAARFHVDAGVFL
jgi:HTH-type transcriptional regulator/antitoxin HigA